MDASQYRRLFSDLPVAWLVHEHGVVRDFNSAAAELFAVADLAGVVGRSLLDFVHPESVGTVRERMRLVSETGRPVQALAERMVPADGRELWVETIAGPTEFDGRPAVQVLCWDITDRVLEQQRLAHAANHDRLTGLPNRALLETRWSALQAGWTSADRRPAVVFGDLDGFKAVNDEHGHAVGDATLRAVAARLSAVLRSRDVLGRYGGDEFVVLVEASGAELTQHLADRLKGALREPVHVLGRVVQVGMSVGLAVPVSADEPLDALLHRADEAMYDSKRGSRPS